MAWICLGDLDNRRPVNVFSPKPDEGTLAICKRVARIPKVTWDHFLVKRKCGSIFGCNQNAVGVTKSVAKFDKAVRALSGDIDDRQRRKMQALEYSDVDERVIAFIGSYLDAAH